MRRRFISNNGFTESFDIDNYLTIEALEDGLSVSFDNDLEYGIDGKGWKILKVGKKTPYINKGQTISFRGNLTPNSSNGIGTFTIPKSCNLKGNCMSMLFGDDAANNFSLIGKDYAFSYLFNNCTTIKSVSSGFLPATTLVKYCYDGMFLDCTGLTQAPELPATTLADSCYGGMFSGCSSLTTAPTLPATTLANNCYSSMFSSCTSLAQSPELPATTLAKNCYYGMFKDTNAIPDCSNIDFSSASAVSSNGLRGLFYNTKVTNADLERILPKNSNGKYCLPVTALADYCYSYMFYGCSSLTTAPELPAMTLAKYCYESMFSSCTSLTQAPELPATTLANSCYNDMFFNCTSLTTPPELPATTLAYYCYRGMFRYCTNLTTPPSILPATELVGSCYYSMFENCTSLTQAPVLPATTLVNDCYYHMFYHCSKLNYIKAMFTTTPSRSYTNYWVDGVARTGTFVKNKNATWNVTATSSNYYSGTPSGWTVQTE